jgi:hypothetical protein
MAQGKQQTSWDSPKFTIDCMLANVSRQLEAEGCVLECLEDGHKLTNPDHLTAGDFVKVRLWLEDDEAFVDIWLAEVRRVQKHWIVVDVIHLSLNDRMRMKRIVDVRAGMHIEKPALIGHLLIRA